MQINAISLYSPIYTANILKTNKNTQSKKINNMPSFKGVLGCLNSNYIETVNPFGKISKSDENLVERANSYLDEAQTILKLSNFAKDEAKSNLLEALALKIQYSNQKESFKIENKDGTFIFVLFENGKITRADYGASEQNGYSHAKKIFLFDENENLERCVHDFYSNGRENLMKRSFVYQTDEKGTNLKACFYNHRPLKDDVFERLYMYQDGKIIEVCKDCYYPTPDSGKCKYEFHFKDDKLKAVAKKCSVTFLDENDDEKKDATCEEAFVYKDGAPSKYFEKVRRYPDCRLLARDGINL